MANTGQPDSATSQFFITLRDTVLPAGYTAFAVVLPESFGVLDKIYDEVEPVKINHKFCLKLQNFQVKLQQKLYIQLVKPYL